MTRRAVVAVILAAVCGFAAGRLSRPANPVPELAEPAWEPRAAMPDGSPVPPLRPAADAQAQTKAGAE